MGTSSGAVLLARWWWRLAVAVWQWLWRRGCLQKPYLLDCPPAEAILALQVSQYEAICASSVTPTRSTFVLFPAVAVWSAMWTGEGGLALGTTCGGPWWSLSEATRPHS